MFKIKKDNNFHIRKCWICGIEQDNLKEDNAIMAFSKMKKKNKKKTRYMCVKCGLMIGKSAEHVTKLMQTFPSTEEEFLPYDNESENAEDGNKKEEKNVTTKENIAPKEIYDYISQYIISQEDAKKAVSVAIYKHYQRINNPEKGIGKSNIMITGPSGTGKTEIVRRISEFLNLPYVVIDVTGLTESGFKGRDVEDILLQLICKAGSIENAQKGIIFLDEIDKLAKKENGGDIAHEGVQQSLLKMIEGAEFSFDIKGPMGENRKMTINTENILFIGSGAFTELEEPKKKSIGFNVTEETSPNKEQTNMQEKLIKFGMLTEFIGRFPVITSTKKLTREDLMNILVNTENSVLKEYQTLFEMEGFSLQITDDSINNIIEETEKLQTGARGLRTTVSNILDEVMFEVPSESNNGIIKIEKGVAKIKLKNKDKNKDKEKEQ